MIWDESESDDQPVAKQPVAKPVAKQPVAKPAKPVAKPLPRPLVDPPVLRQLGSLGEHRRIVVVTGPGGCGKTTAVRWALQRLGIARTLTADDVDDIQETASPLDPTQHLRLFALRRPVEEPRCVFFDDAEGISEKLLGALRKVFDAESTIWDTSRTVVVVTVAPDVYWKTRWMRDNDRCVTVTLRSPRLQQVAAAFGPAAARFADGNLHQARLHAFRGARTDAVDHHYERYRARSGQPLRHDDALWSLAVSHGPCDSMGDPAAFADAVSVANRLQGQPAAAFRGLAAAQLLRGRPPARTCACRRAAPRRRKLDVHQMAYECSLAAGCPRAPASAADALDCLWGYTATWGGRIPGNTGTLARDLYDFGAATLP